MHGRKKEEKEKGKNNAKFSGHYVCPRTHNVRAQALCSHQKKLIALLSLTLFLNFMVESSCMLVATVTTLWRYKHKFGGDWTESAICSYKFQIIVITRRACSSVQSCKIWMGVIIVIVVPLRDLFEKEAPLRYHFSINSLITKILRKF